jgi:hypothetical protein
MSDALNSMFDFNDAAYDGLLNDAKKDDRVGPQVGVVVKVTDDQWPSGDDRRKVLFSLPNAGNSKADLTWSAPPPDTAEESKLRKETGKGNWDRAKLQGVAKAINVGRQLAQHYGKASPLEIREGETYRIEVVATKKQPDGSGGFLRVVAFLPQAGSENGGAPASGGKGPGF